MAPVDQFIAAIAQQESGGNYNAYNPSGAIGKYQILAGNIPAWSQKYLGRPMTAAQFRSSPALQDELGRAVLTDFYNRYGAAGAASAWYSGNPNAYASTRSQPGGPSIKGYVDSVLKRMGSATESLDLSKQPQDSPISPWRMPQDSQTSTPLSPSTGAGLESVDKQDDLSANVGVGLDAATGMESAPAVPSSPMAAGDLPSIAGTTTSSTTGSGNPPMGAGANGLRGAALDIARRALGTWYVWGGNSLQYGVDCSGLVQQSLKLIGINVPRLSYDQLKMGPRVSLAQAQPGDLIGWGDGHHVAFYLGNGQILEAPHTGAQVRVRQLGANEGTFAVSLANLYH